MRKKLLIIICTTFLAISCASTESTSEDDESTSSGPGDLAEEYRDEDLSETELLLLRTRSELSNHYFEDMVNIPDLYLQEIMLDERQIDPYAGFRVQLLSTRNVAEADSVRDSFVVWADSVMSGYMPDAYVDFRPPNYRVRAGDFQDRERAIHFSGLLKSRYPEAWIIHDRIEPSNVPADTADIRFKDLDALEFEEEIEMMESPDTTSIDR